MDFADVEQDPSLGAVGELLRRERAVLTFDERQRLEQRLQVSGSPRGPRRASRLAVILCLAVGLLFTTAGTGLAISGFSTGGAAEQAQYPDRTTLTFPAQAPATQPTPRHGSAPRSHPSSLGQVSPPSSSSLSTPGSLRRAETRGNAPFTGFGAIPILVAGVGLIVTGGVVHRRG